jgi:L-threonylcarbamoyladenylate synthase
LVLAQGDKLGVRVSPSQLVARLLDAAQVPITATSSNISGKKSCVAANRVFYFFNGRIDLILDRGKAKVFLPSTVLDVSTDEVSLIRLGHIPLEEIKKVVPKIKIPEGEPHDNANPQQVKVDSVPENPQKGEEQTQAGALG